MLSQESELQEVVMKRNIWHSSSSEEDDKTDKNELKLLCYKFDLEIIRNKGFQKPKLTIYLMIFCFVNSVTMLTLVFGYATNWDKFSYFPVFFGQSILHFYYFKALSESKQIQFQKTKFQKILVIMMKNFLGALSAFSVLYSNIFNPPFENVVYFMIMLYPISINSFYIFCVGSNYDDLPQTYFSDKNNNNSNNNQIHPQIPNISRQNQFVASTRYLKKNKFELKTEELDEWAIYKQRLWTSLVIAIMFVDVVSDVYYGYSLFYTYRALSTFLGISGIALVACSVADLLYVFFMLLFPGWVSHFAHSVAFLMELPNFVLTGISIWKLQQMKNQELVEENQSVSLAIFSIISTLLNGFIHVVYIVDSWAVKNAIEFVQRLQ